VKSEGSRERGAALLVVVLCLAALLPLALGLSSLVLRRQHQVGRWQGESAGRLAVQGAYQVVWARIEARTLSLRPGETRVLRLSEVGPTGVTVRIRRQPDVGIGLDGRVVPASAADLEQRVVDAEGRVFCPWRLLEVYQVEAEAGGTAAGPDVRLLGGLARLDDGRTLSLGQRYDRRGG
jgi:hypothetical protein